MASVTVSDSGLVAPVSTQSFIDITIPAVGAGNALIAYGVAFAGTTRSFTNGGGTWHLVRDDGASNACWVNYAPNAGTTSVRFDNGGTNAAMLARVREVSGLLANGAVYLTPSGESSGTTAAWATDTITVASANGAYCVGACYNSTSNIATSVPGAGYSVISGTNVTSGNLIDSINSDVLFLESGDFPAGNVTATGTWSGTNNWLFADVFGFELAPAAAGSSGAVLLLQ